MQKAWRLQHEDFGLKNFQHPFEIYLRYVILHLQKHVHKCVILLHEDIAALT